MSPTTDRQPNPTSDNGSRARAWLAFPGSAPDSQRLGGKGAALAALDGAGLAVPPWLVVTGDAFLDSLDPGQLRRWSVARDGTERADLAASLALGEPIRWALLQALEDLGPAEGFAVRSSAVEEDAAGHSFAGQLDSFLWVGAAEVPGHVAAVWRSAFAPRVLAYRAERGIPGPPPAPAVLVQVMVDADAAGVAFGADPVSGRRGVRVVSATPGLADHLVSGEAPGDTWRVGRDGRILERLVGDKAVARRRGPDGPTEVSLAPERGCAPSLQDDQVRAVSRLAEACGAHFGRPQDIEWALAGDRLYLLQSRPITTLGGLADPDGERRVFDNANIAESYQGIVSPLTFAFARRAYEGVYRQMLHLLGVSSERIADHGETFRQMLCYVQGRVYYNLASWYRALALLPGFSVSRGFMEQMMGVREPLPESVLAEVRRDRLLDALHLARTALGLILALIRLPRTIARFYARLEDALAEPDPPLAQRRPDELAAYYRDLERRLLARWDAPLLNDLFAMVFFGLLRRSVERWVPDTRGALHNDLLSGQGGMVSVEPARRLAELARRIRTEAPALATIMGTGEAGQVQAALAPHGDLAAAIADYLSRFGDRCLEELKLESPTLADDPLPLYRALARLAASAPSKTRGAVETPRARAEATVAQTFKGRPLRRRLFRWVLGQARARLRDRENLRFERTRLFGRVRRVFVELGRRLYAEGALADPRDVFLLEVEEVLGFVTGTATTTDLAGLVRLRRAQLSAWEREPPPPDRFETVGAVHLGNRFTPTPGPEPAQGAEDHGDRRHGLGVYPGVVRGTARVVTDPGKADLPPGSILVAPRTDPGWVLLFPACAALVVERGSLLSHAAIVARELGIPAVVALAGATRWLRDGDPIEVDGARGTVRRLPGAPG
jgi:pyruvate,water dikinase